MLPLCVFSQRLDTERETIELVHTSPTEIRELPARIPSDAPRYHFFLYKHSYQGQSVEAVGQSLGLSADFPLYFLYNMNGGNLTNSLVYLIFNSIWWSEKSLGIVVGANSQKRQNRVCNNAVCICSLCWFGCGLNWILFPPSISATSPESIKVVH